jgi:hypothetical protein
MCDMKAKVLKHKTLADTYGKFIPFGGGQEIGHVLLPQVFEKDSAMGELRAYMNQNKKYWENALEQLSDYEMVEIDIKPSITGEDVAALLSNIHEHYPGEEGVHKLAGKIIYFEEDLLPVLEALGLPAPEWKKSMSVKQWKKSKNI